MASRGFKELYPVIKGEIKKMKVLTDIRISCHQLAQPEFEKPADLVEWMGAVQAQDYAMSKWAVGMRLKSGTLQKVDEALAKGEIVRTHIMRPTWHYVAGKDLRWLQQLTAPRVKKVIDSWVKAGGLDISEKTYTKCNDLIGGMLAGKRCFTREEIETELERAGILVANDRVKRYLLRAEMEGIVCSGGDKAGKPTYALLDDQVASVPALHPEEALAQLAIRYFQSHSPATLKDFIWWSGLTVTDAKRAVRLIDHQLFSEYFDEQEFLVFHSYREAEHKHLLHFLPSYDEYLISYKDRTTVIAAEHHPKAFNRWGTFYPVILSNGRIVGNWNKTRKKEEIVITSSFFEEVKFKEEDLLLQQAANRYRFFLKGSVSGNRDEKIVS